MGKIGPGNIEIGEDKDWGTSGWPRSDEWEWATACYHTSPTVFLGGGGGFPKLKKLTQCLANTGPPSTTLSQHTTHSFYCAKMRQRTRQTWDHETMRPNARLMLAHLLQSWANISPALGQRVEFGASAECGPASQTAGQQLRVKASCWVYYATPADHWPGNVSV